MRTAFKISDYALKTASLAHLWPSLYVVELGYHLIHMNLISQDPELNLDISTSCQRQGQG